TGRAPSAPATSTPSRPAPATVAITMVKIHRCIFLLSSRHVICGVAHTTHESEEKFRRTHIEINCSARSIYLTRSEPSISEGVLPGFHSSILRNRKGVGLNGPT